MDTRTLTDYGTSPLFSLLQICDPYFPIGTYTQSFGLETYVQKGIVHDAGSTEQYIRSFLNDNFLFNDLLAVKLSWEYADKQGLDNLCKLNRILTAAKAAREIRNASLKLGARFIKILETVLGENHLFCEFVKSCRNEGPGVNYSVVFGLCTRLFNVDKNDALAALSYSTASSIINNCAKLVPISQKDGQKILFASHTLLMALLARVESLTLTDIGVCASGFDIRAMQHERLYSRLYIS